MKIKKTIPIIFLILLCFLLEIFKYQAIPSNSSALSNLGGLIKKVPVSIPYAIFSIAILYFIGRLSFFKNIQIGTGLAYELLIKRKKSTSKEIVATIIFGLIVVGLLIGFIIIIFNGTQ